MRVVGVAGFAPGALWADGDVAGDDAGRRRSAKKNRAQVQGCRARRRRLSQGRKHVGPDFVAAPADRRPKVHRQVLWLAPKGFGHCGQPRLQHASRGPAPACVKERHRSSRRVGHEDGHAVGQGHRQQQARRAGRVSVAVASQHEPVRRSLVHAHSPAVHLAAAQHGAPRPPAVQPSHGVGGDVGPGPASGFGTGVVLRTRAARSAGRPGPQPGKRGAPSGHGRGLAGDGHGGTRGVGHVGKLVCLWAKAGEGLSVLGETSSNKVDWSPR